MYIIILKKQKADCKYMYKNTYRTLRIQINLFTFLLINIVAL